MWNREGRGELDRRLVRILEVDPDLAADLDGEAAQTASAQLSAPVVRIEWPRHRGRWGPSEPREHLGLLVVDGLLLREVQLLGSAAAEVLGEGDLLRPWGRGWGTRHANSGRGPLDC